MQILLPVFSIVATVALFLLSLLLNELLFVNSELIPGVNWIYLPAGMRLLCLLMFGGWGAVGVLLASWITSFGYYFPEPDQFMRPFVGGIISALAPYLVYKLAQYRFGLDASLANLTPTRLLVCIVAYAFASPFLHHVLFVMLGKTDNLLSTFIAMFTGDLAGTLIVIYTFKALLAWWTPPQQRSTDY